MTCRWELGPVCSVTPCCWDERLDTGQKTGTAFTVRTAFAKHQNICLTPLSKLCFSGVMITKTDNICFYLHCALEKNCFLSNFLRWRKTQSQSFPLWQFCWRAAHAGKLNHVCWHMIRLQAHKGRCHAVLCRHGSVSARCLDTQARQSIRLHRKGDFWNENVCRAHLCKWRSSNKVSLMLCVCEQRKLKGSYWVFRANNNLGFLLGAPTMMECIRMSSICYIFR